MRKSQYQHPPSQNHSNPSSPESKHGAFGSQPPRNRRFLRIPQLAMCLLRESFRDNTSLHSAHRNLTESLKSPSLWRSALWIDEFTQCRLASHCLENVAPHGQCKCFFLTKPHFWRRTSRFWLSTSLSSSSLSLAPTDSDSLRRRF